MVIIFTKHLLERMLQRGINKETVIEILRSPDTVKDSFENRKIAIKNMDKKWNVVFVKEKEKIVVLTVYFD